MNGWSRVPDTLFGLLPLGVMLALDVASTFVSRWVGVGLAGTAALIGIAWLVYLLNAYDFPWPRRHR